LGTNTAQRAPGREWIYRQLEFRQSGHARVILSDLGVCGSIYISIPNSSTRPPWWPMPISMLTHTGETRPIRGSHFRAWLRCRYCEETGEAPGDQVGARYWISLTVCGALSKSARTAGRSSPPHGCDFADRPGCFSVQKGGSLKEIAFFLNLAHKPGRRSVDVNLERVSW